MKCIPPACAGRVVAAARRVIEMLEVFEARTASGLHAASSFLKRSLFTVTSSNAASMTTSTFARSCRSVEVRMRPAISDAGRGSLPFGSSFASADGDLAALQLLEAHVDQDDLQARRR